MSGQEDLLARYKNTCLNAWTGNNATPDVIAGKRSSFYDNHELGIAIPPNHKELGDEQLAASLKKLQDMNLMGIYHK